VTAPVAPRANIVRLVISGTVRLTTENAAWNAGGGLPHAIGPDSQPVGGRSSLRTHA